MTRRMLTNGKKFNIYVVGAIGSGKTEFSKALNARLCGELKLEPVETNPFIELMYEDAEKYAGLLQEYMLFELYKQSEGGVSGIKVFDSSFEVNKMFEESQWMGGNITDESHRQYLGIYSKLKELAEHNTIPIYVVLHVPSKLALERIFKRGREYENESGVEFFRENVSGVETKLLKYIQESSSNIIHVDNENIEKVAFAETVTETYEEIREIIRRERGK